MDYETRLVRLGSGKARVCRLCNSPFQCSLGIRCGLNDDCGGFVGYAGDSSTVQVQAAGT